MAAGGGARGGVSRRGLGMVGAGGVSVWCVGGPVPGGGAGEDGLGVALLVAAGEGGGCCARWESGRPAGSCRPCVWVSCGSRGPWLAAELKWEVVAWASGWGCGSLTVGGCRWAVLVGRGCG